ncbi:MAG TPA: aminotransferase class I/II-fold pyridoxal phosphate-dependent enzyme [Planctomycetota bacterium]|nr:aminotransferase class I/II-fold pyridoxal phosphate-dependent enzyme [Planctomycetota bacterium]
MNPTSRSTLIPSSAARSGDDPIFELNAEARRRAAAGEPVINCTLGAMMEDDGRLAVMPTVIETLARVPGHEAAAYAPIAGDAPFLRAVVADVYGDGALAAQTVAVATPGGSGALYLAVTNFLEPGQALLTTNYYWGPYQTIAAHAGRRLESFEMFAPSGGFHFAAFEAALLRQIERQGRVLLFLNSPCHNPTGYSIDDGEWDVIAGIVQRAADRAPIAVLVDIAYARYGAKVAPDWARHVPRIVGSATVLVAWSASKSFAQYGARTGALLATHPDAAERTRIQNALAFACRGTWSNCNHLGLLAITQLLTDPALRARADKDRERLIAVLGERVAVFNREAAAAGLAHPRYEGGFFVAVFTPDPQQCAARLREQGMFVVPLTVENGGAVRIALCSTPASQVPRLVAALARAVGAGG